MKRALFWSLLPLVIPQALHVRRTAPRFAPATGLTRGSVGDAASPLALRLLAIGDSVVAGVGAGTTDRALAGATAVALSRLTGRPVSWVAEGLVGAGAASVRQQLLPKIPDAHFDAVVISAGVNDVTALRRSHHWVRDLTDLVEALRERYPMAAIVMPGLPPLEVFPLLPSPLKHVAGLRGRHFSGLAERAISGRSNMRFIQISFTGDPAQFCGDGFHPSPACYATIGQALGEAVASMLPPRRA